MKPTDLSHLPRDLQGLLKAGGITRITHYAGRSKTPRGPVHPSRAQAQQNQAGGER